MEPEGRMIFNVPVCVAYRALGPFVDSPVKLAVNEDVAMLWKSSRGWREWSMPGGAMTTFAPVSNMMIVLCGDTIVAERQAE